LLNILGGDDSDDSLAPSSPSPPSPTSSSKKSLSSSSSSLLQTHPSTAGKGPKTTPSPVNVPDMDDSDNDPQASSDSSSSDAESSESEDTKKHIPLKHRQLSKKQRSKKERETKKAQREEEQVLAKLPTEPSFATRKAIDLQEKVSLKSKTLKKRDKLVSHSTRNLEAMHRRIVQLTCRVTITTTSGMVMELLPLRLSMMEILGEKGGQRLLDPAMVSLITELVAWNPYVDVSAMGVWIKNMYELASQVTDVNIHSFKTSVYGGQHYFEGVVGAGELLPAIKDKLENRHSAMYSFGFLTMWNECKYLDKQISSQSKIFEIPVEDVGITVGVGKGWRLRYPVRDGQTYTAWAMENLPDFLDELTEEEINHIPTVQLARATLVAEHNDVSHTTQTNKHKPTNTKTQRKSYVYHLYIFIIHTLYVLDTQLIKQRDYFFVLKLLFN
jgi:hypothetical protein